MAPMLSSGRRDVGRRLRFAGVLLAAVAGLAGVGVVAVAPTAPAGAQTSVTLDYTCAAITPVALSDLSLSVAVEVTAPSSVPSSQQVTVDTTATVGLPPDMAETLSALAPSLNMTGLTVTQVSADVDATGLTPTTQTDTAEGLPVTLAVAQLSSPVTATLTPLTFTTGPPGTATVSAADLDINAAIVGGALNGTFVAVTCTPGMGNPPLASVTVSSALPGTPAVTAVSPTSGPAAGGTSVTITGSGFTDATAVDFGTTPAASFTVTSDTSITAVSPPGRGTVDVTVVNPTATSVTSPADQFAYLEVPVVSTVSPDSGPATGGTTVTITGTGFTDATAVDFGTTGAPSFTVTSDTSVTAVSPDLTDAAVNGSGAVDVIVVGPEGTSATTAADQFFVGALLAYTCSSSAPISISGYPLPLTVLDVTTPSTVQAGQNLTLGASLSVELLQGLEPLFGTASVTGVSLTQLAVGIDATGASPATQTDAADGLPIALTLEQAYAPVPATLAPLTFTAGEPGTATFTAGDLDVTAVIEGGSLSGAATSLTCTPNAGNPPLATLTVTAPPVVSAVSPTSGPATGGTTVTITGTGLNGATGVDFGSNPATSFTVDSDTSITATSSAGSGTHDVTVTTPGGTSPTSPADQFTYLSVPNVSAISPDSGLAAGGTTVTITGTGFNDATAVDFGTTAAPSFTVTSDTSITAVSPDLTDAAVNGSGAVDVTVVGPKGTSATTAADQFFVGALLAYTCSITTPVPLTNYGLPMALLDVTTPSTVQAGQGLTVDASLTVQPLQPEPVGLGESYSLSLTQLAVGIDASGATPATQTDDAEGLPVAPPGLNTVDPSPVTLALAPLTFTAGGPGTATFTAGALDLTLVIEGGSLSGTAASLACTPNAGNPPLASVTVTAPTPAVSAVSPDSGPAAGGTTITITGTGFTDATAVDFGTTPATTFTVTSDTSITATAPAGSGTEAVTVTTPGGTSMGLPFTYRPPPPTVTAVFPGSGPTTGFSLVFVLGSHFTDVTRVTFGTGSALWLTFAPDLMLALTPPTTRPGPVDVQVTAAGGTSPTSAADRYTYVPRPAGRA